MSERISAITMPKLGLSMTEGAVSEWHVQPGEEIARGQVIADIETSKIVNELEAQVSGTLRKTCVKPGVDVPVGALIAVVAEADVPDEEIESFVSRYSADGEDGEQPESPGTKPEESGEAADTTGDSASSSPAVDVPQSLAGHYDRDAVFASHHAHKLAQRLGIDLTLVEGTGRRNRISRKDVERAVINAGGSTGTADDEAAEPARDGSIRTTPAAQRLADRHEIDLAAVPSTGNRGRTTKGDVLRYIERQGAPPAATESSSAFPSTSGSFEEHELGRTRKVIAARLAESKRSAPHYRLSVDVITDKLLELRRDIEQGEPKVRVSINDMLVRAAALALAQHPDVNIQFDGQTVRRFAHADIAVAVAAESGLVTPIVRNADEKGLIEIAKELADLIERAQSGKLKPDDLEGGTFTLSNLGMYGIKSFDAIINPPQGAIMAIGRAERRLYVGDDDGGRVATFMTVTLSCDHRVIDGAMGARFLKTFKEILHHPGRLLL